MGCSRVRLGCWRPRGRPFPSRPGPFSRYDLYSKGDGEPDAKALRPYYEELALEFFPEPLKF
jgi:Myo-inositol oxygenase